MNQVKKQQSRFKIVLIAALVVGVLGLSWYLFAQNPTTAPSKDTVQFADEAEAQPGKIGDNDSKDPNHPTGNAQDKLRIQQLKMAISASKQNRASGTEATSEQKEEMLKSNIKTIRDKGNMDNTLNALEDAAEKQQEESL